MNEEEFLKNKRPWWGKGSAEWLNKQLNPNFKVLEFGSGGSTLFFAERCEEVISIENNKEFHKLLSEYIKKDNFTNIKLHLLEKESKLFYNEEQYNNIINSFPDNYFNIILVDPNGINRNRVVETTINKLKQDGYLILDNYEWFLENPETKQTRWHTSSYFGTNFKNWETYIFNDENKSGKGTAILKK